MLQQIRRFPLVAILVLATAVSACGEDDPTDEGDDDGTSTVTFTYNEPQGVDVTAVSVPGMFNDWNPAAQGFHMEEISEGHWELTVELEPGVYEYKYYFDGTTWSSNMCDDAQFGNQDGVVSPQNEGCTGDFGNATITVVDDND